MYQWRRYPPYPCYYGNGYGQPGPQGYGYGPYAAQAPMPQQPQPQAPAGASNALLPFTSDSFLKGALIGAAAAYILTNENVQHSMIKGTVKAWHMLQGGVEEVKERFQDAEAELMAEQAAEE